MAAVKVTSSLPAEPPSGFYRPPATRFSSHFLNEV
jgi:hypothetical protein